MPRRAAAPENQPSLFDQFDPTPPPPPPPPAPPKPRSNRRHRLGLPRPWAARTHGEHLCLVCGHTEDDGACLNGCATVCGRPQPQRRDGKAAVEVCLITTTTTARLVQGASAYQRPGRRLAVVTCPRCGRVNWHRPAGGRAYRVGQCGHPYISTERSTP
ncbi:hypothetical protein [Nonomuraea sp. NPDC049709]|uniref:hypothetical protein n=1 Tax=Nonomuraea sp. NPDC049709 TaxID=3154736 RepID=UPI00341BF3D3